MSSFLTSSFFSEATLAFFSVILEFLVIASVGRETTSFDHPGRLLVLSIASVRPCHHARGRRSGRSYSGDFDIRRLILLFLLSILVTSGSRGTHASGERDYGTCPWTRVRIVTYFQNVPRLVIRLRSDHDIRLSHYLFVNERSVSYKDLITCFKCNVITGPRTLGRSFSILVYLGNLIVIRTYRARERTLRLAIEKDLCSFGETFLYYVSGSCAHLVFRNMNLTILLGKCKVRVFVGRGTYQDFNFLCRVFTMTRFARLMGTTIGFFRFTGRHVIFVRFPVTVDVKMGLGCHAERLIIKVVLVGLYRDSVTLGRMISGFSFRGFIRLTSYRNSFFLKRCVSLQTFSFASCPDSVQRFNGEGAAVVF